MRACLANRAPRALRVTRRPDRTPCARRPCAVRMSLSLVTRARCARWGRRTQRAMMPRVRIRCVTRFTAAPTSMSPATSAWRAPRTPRTSQGMTPPGLTPPAVSSASRTSSSSITSATLALLAPRALRVTRRPDPTPCATRSCAVRTSLSPETPAWRVRLAPRTPSAMTHRVRTPRVMR